MQVPHLNVVVVSATEQKEWVEKAMPVAINLDPFSRVAGHFGLDVCRVFSADQRVALRIQERPGSPPLIQQIKAIPAGEWTLMDDDICTGTTVSAVKAAILSARNDVKIKGSWSLIHEWWAARGGATGEIEDVIDSHDFIPGEHTSGLVVEGLEGVGRVLYTDPRVDLKHRASFRDPVAFRAAWSNFLASQKV